MLGMRYHGTWTVELLFNHTQFEYCISLIYFIVALTCIRSVFDHVNIFGNLIFLSIVLFYHAAVYLMNKHLSNQICWWWVGWRLRPVTKVNSVCRKWVFLGGMSGRFGAVVGPRRVRDVGITLPTGE